MHTVMSDLRPFLGLSHVSAAGDGGNAVLQDSSVPSGYYRVYVNTYLGTDDAARLTEFQTSRNKGGWWVPVESTAAQGGGANRTSLFNTRPILVDEGESFRAVVYALALTKTAHLYVAYYEMSHAYSIPFFP